MKPCYVQVLEMHVTNKCNLDCAHCSIGEKNNNNMPDNVIEASLDQVKGVGTLTIGGGEPTLALDRIEKIISYIIKKRILIEEFTVTTNGIIYSQELLELLDEINNYIGNKNINALFAISIDKYHLEEIKKLGIVNEFFENLNKYRQSKYFYGLRDTKQKLFREGNAINLDEKLTVPLRPVKPVITYVNKQQKLDIENGLCNIGPLIAINTNGIITECDASIEHQETLYNYGNILNETIEEVCLKNNSPILKPKQFGHTTAKLLKKYWTYNK